MNKACAFFLILLTSSCATKKYNWTQAKEPPEQNIANHSLQKRYTITSKTSPRYPSRALQIHQEGWVLLEFSLSKSGYPENIIVKDSSPDGIFDMAAINALSEWRISSTQPDMEGNVIQQLFEFTMKK